MREDDPRSPRLGPENTATRFDVLGIHVSDTDMPRALRAIDCWVSQGERQHVCVCDVNALLNARKDPELTRFCNASGLTLPDGVPLVWAGRLAGVRTVRRVCGPDLMPLAVKLSETTGWKHFFLGGAPGVAARLEEMLRREYPRARIVGHFCPPFRPATDSETRELINMINQSGADIVWVGLGAPKQEQWMCQARPCLQAAVIIGVGAAFNFQIGDVRRAPRVMQIAGLEWLYRLLSEPRRLWRRYLFGVPTFIALLARRPPRKTSTTTST